MFSDIRYIKLVSKIVVGYTSLIRQAYPYASIRYNAREKRIYMSVFIKKILGFVLKCSYLNF